MITVLKLRILLTTWSFSSTLLYFLLLNKGNSHLGQSCKKTGSFGSSRAVLSNIPIDNDGKALQFVVSNMVASSNMWLWSTWHVACVTEKLKLIKIHFNRIASCYCIECISFLFLYSRLSQTEQFTYPLITSQFFRSKVWYTLSSQLESQRTEMKVLAGLGSYLETWDKSAYRPI